MYTAIEKFLTENNISYHLNEPMCRHTSFRIGGNADIFVYIDSTDNLSRLIKLLKERNIYYFILGKGSNILVSDKGIKGVVLSLEKLNEIKLEKESIVAQSGASIASLCRFALNNSYSGLEFAFGIPGSIGGAVYMNAGAYGGEIKDVIKSAVCMNSEGKLLNFSSEDMNLSYRNSIFKDNSFIILSAEFVLKKGQKSEISEKMNLYLNRRKEKQPLEYASAGSTFKRPDGYFAGTLIEQNNLKGFSVGGAQVSKKHAGFVINKGNATANDVLSLIKKIQETVFSNNGIRLCPEVIFVGEKN